GGRRRGRDLHARAARGAAGRRAGAGPAGLAHGRLVLRARWRARPLPRRPARPAVPALPTLGVRERGARPRLAAGGPVARPGVGQRAAAGALRRLAAPGGGAVDRADRATP